LIHTEKNIILIGGTSHTGKSTLAEFLASKFGSINISTDKLARHPGRPWKERLEEIPLHVQQHYFNLPIDQLLADVLKHYQKMWPIVQSVIESNTNNLVMEGSALLPQLVKQINLKEITAVWLTATDVFLKDRIYRSADYLNKSVNEKFLIDKFVSRTIAFDHFILKEVKALKLPFLEVQKFGSVADLAKAVKLQANWQ
jgi:2-phosphoglycerate kinase